MPACARRSGPVCSAALMVRLQTPFLRRLGALLALTSILAGSPAAAVEDAELAKVWTADPSHVPYRAIETPGRREGERLPLIVFLHGDWQDGTDNQAQLA